MQHLSAGLILFDTGKRKLNCEELLYSLINQYTTILLRLERLSDRGLSILALLMGPVKEYFFKNAVPQKHDGSKRTREGSRQFSANPRLVKPLGHPIPCDDQLQRGLPHINDLNRPATLSCDFELNSSPVTDQFSNLILNDVAKKKEKLSPTRSVSFLQMQKNDSADDDDDDDDEVSSEILRSHSFSNANVQTRHPQGYTPINCRNKNNSPFSSTICYSKSQTLPCESNRADSENMMTNLSGQSGQNYLISSLNSSVSFAKSASKPALKEQCEESEEPTRQRAYSMNTLSTNHKRSADVGELSSILYTSTNGKRLPRASVNDLRLVFDV